MTKITITIDTDQETNKAPKVELLRGSVLNPDDKPLTEVDLPRVREQPLPMDWNIESKVRELRFKMWDAAYVECEGNKTKMFKLLGYANYQTLFNQMKSNGYIIPKFR